MKCDDIKELLVDYLYRETTAEDAEQLERHTKRCKSCREELAELQKTSTLLKQWPDIDPKMKLVFVQEKKALLSSLVPSLDWRHRPIRKFALGLAFGLASLLVLLALTNTTVSVKDGDFQISASLFSRQQPLPDDVIPMTAAALAELQHQNLAHTQELIAASQERQRNEFALALTELAKKVDYQRDIDMRLLGRGIEEVQYQTASRLDRTDRALNDFFRLANAEQKLP
jgi:hypothetical protein